ncbi:MAG: hypothetical protein E6J20_18375 [Chloroflexi bacterium]|nr:MAG: hypothetical protein E6J20_18375 [Chloroflexota bacterium]
MTSVLRADEPATTVARHGTSRRRRRPRAGVIALVLAILVTFFLFVVGVPIWAMRRGDWDAAITAGVIQAAASVFGAIAGAVALVAAVLAYDDAQQRPELALRVRNSLSGISFQLQNTGPVSAANPRVVVRCLNYPYLRPSEDGVGRGQHSVQWRLSDHLTGGLGYNSLTWVPRITSRVIHPDLTLETPPLDFSRAGRSPVNGPGEGSLVLELKVSWTADRAAMLSERMSLRLPTGRDETYY